MSKFDRKNKKIFIILLIVIAIGFCYFIYAKDEGIVVENTKENNFEEEQIKNENKKIMVHVSGAVNLEGVVEVEENARVIDAIEKAGGLREDAIMDSVNLALVLEDGMKISIPSINEQEKVVIVEDNNLDSKVNLKKVNINLASQNELETLNGIGASTAQKIVSYRKENGKFENIEDIKNVSGIGDNKFNSIKENICVK